MEESLAWTNWWVCIRDVAFPIHLLKENSQRHKPPFCIVWKQDFIPTHIFTPTSERSWTTRYFFKLWVMLKFQIRSCQKVRLCLHEVWVGVHRMYAHMAHAVRCPFGGLITQVTHLTCFQPHVSNTHQIPVLNHLIQGALRLLRYMLPTWREGGWWVGKEEVHSESGNMLKFGVDVRGFV